MNTSEVLNRAADHIAEFGHWKGGGHGSGSIFTAPACTIGACNLASLTAPHLFAGALDAVRAYLAGSNVVVWNDRPERTAAEVIEVLRAAAIIEAAREVEVQVVSA